MEIIILGAGQVGGSLAGILSAEGHNIVLVDINQDRLLQLQDHLDVRTVVGYCSYPSVLRAAGAANADMLIAVSSNDEANMLACQVAFSLFDTPIKIARIRCPHYFIDKKLFSQKDLPIDEFISPEQLVTKQVQQLIHYPGALQVLDFVEGTVKLVAVRICNDGSLAGKTIGEAINLLSLTPTKFVALYRGYSLVSLDNSIILQEEDEVFFIAATEHVADIIDMFCGKQEEFKRIMIAGGGNIGRSLALEIEGDYKTKVIERDLDVCKNLSELLQSATVLHGDATDKELLASENIEDVDVFFATASNDEENILSALQAKRLGVRQVMATVTRTVYVDLIEGQSINIVVSPQQATISSILAKVRQSNVVNAYSLRHGSSEAIEIVVREDKAMSKVVGLTVAEIALPENTIIGVIVRSNKIVIPDDNTIVESDDHVIIFIADTKDINQVEQLFKLNEVFFR